VAIIYSETADSVQRYIKQKSSNLNRKYIYMKSCVEIFIKNDN